MYAESMYWPAYRVSLCELEEVCKEHAALEGSLQGRSLESRSTHVAIMCCQTTQEQWAVCA